MLAQIGLSLELKITILQCLLERTWLPFVRYLVVLSIEFVRFKVVFRSAQYLIMYTATFSNRIMQYHLFSYSTFTASNFAQLSCINTIIIFYLEARTHLALPRIALARAQNYSAILIASFFKYFRSNEDKWKICS